MADRHPVTIGSLAKSAHLPLFGNPDVVISDLVYDSRAVSAGCCFTALRGGYVDGHDYAAEAVRRGAAALLVEECLDIEAPQIVAPNSRETLAAVAAQFFGHPSRELKVIGITGTDGKTTTSFLTEAMLRRAGKTTGMVGTVHLRIGDLVQDHSVRQTTPESVDIQRYLRRMVESGVKWAVLEATSHGLAQYRLDHVEFDVAAVTNVTHEHLEFHGTIDAYREAKGILFARTGARGGIAVINRDDEGAMAMRSFAAGARLVDYSMVDSDARVLAQHITSSSVGSDFELVVGKSRQRVNLPMLGDFNIANALCAAGIGLACGLELDQVVDGLNHAPDVPGRLERLDLGQLFSVVVDYAHTPESLKKVLILLRGLHPAGRLIVVTGSAGERDTLKRPMQGRVAQEFADYAVFSSEDPRFEDPEKILLEVAAGAVAAGGAEGRNFVSLVDRREAIAHAFAKAGAGDCVLLAGKGHEQSMIWGNEKREWLEARVARELLIEMGYG